MKKSKSIFAVVIATLLVVVLCTWIFPSASFNATLVEGEKLQVGLFDLLSYPMVALTYFGYVLIYTLVVGMFYGVANKIPAYYVLIERSNFLSYRYDITCYNCISNWCVICYDICISIYYFCCTCNGI